MTSRDIIDVHAHLGPYSRFFIPQAGAAEMITVMDRTGTAMAVLSSNHAIQSDAASGNDATLAAVRAHPDRLAGYLVINPWQQPEAQLDRLTGEREFVGIKLHPSLHRYPLTGPRYRPVWEFADRVGCPVLTHTDGDSPFDHPAMLGSIGARYPGARIILGHSGISPAGVDEAIETARSTANLYLEICGSHLNEALLVAMVEAIGAERVLFGSDFPFIDQRMSLGRVLYADLDPADRTAILSSGARRVFTWRPLPGPVAHPRRERHG